MKRFHLNIIYFFLLAGLGLYAFTLRVPANDRYRPGDWVSYGVNRYISSVAASPEQAFFGTTTGIARYDILRNQWQAPYTTSDGLADNRMSVIGFDHITSTLWCGHAAGLSRQHPASLRWTNFPKIEFGLAYNDEFVSLGFDNNYNWFETASGRMYRQDKFGNIFSPADGLAPEASVIWFGARAPRPRMFPQFFMPAGFLFDPKGIVQDNHLRQAPVTSISEDRWGNMWLGTWGLGALRVDVNLGQARPSSFGLASQRVDPVLFDEEVCRSAGRATASHDTRKVFRREYKQTKVRGVLLSIPLRRDLFAGAKTLDVDAHFRAVGLQAGLQALPHPFALVVGITDENGFGHLV
ncbi:hypothetical protein DCC62_15080 [candidate division KSB1 bacterium]|nr:MAG: hypothetical protein DCC62_15080 [candidate division KSB1 bacterium]